jgi:mevalonate kinase
MRPTGKEISFKANSKSEPAAITLFHAFVYSFCKYCERFIHLFYVNQMMFKDIAPAFFPAKVLLFGEYGIVAGGSGLAIPYTKYGGELSIDGPSENLSVHNQSSQSIRKLFNFIKTNSPDFPFMDIAQFETDLNAGLWFDSSIPNGYGLGSSGALVAALYSKYRIGQIDDPVTVKRRLAAIESFFHGSSSGIDPTVAYFRQPLLMHNAGSVELLSGWSLGQAGLKVYLVDTGLVSKTLNLVEWFKSQMLKPQFSKYANSDYIDVNRLIVDKIKLTGMIALNDVLAISHYQIDYFTPMIPESFREHFFAGLKTRSFAFKLCGSGGGGYMLCFSESDSVEEYLSVNRLAFEKVC